MSKHSYITISSEKAKELANKVITACALSDKITLSIDDLDVLE